MKLTIYDTTRDCILFDDIVKQESNEIITSYISSNYNDRHYIDIKIELLSEYEEGLKVEIEVEVENDDNQNKYLKHEQKYYDNFAEYRSGDLKACKERKGVCELCKIEIDKTK